MTDNITYIYYGGLSQNFPTENLTIDQQLERIKNDLNSKIDNEILNRQTSYNKLYAYIPAYVSNAISVVYNYIKNIETEQSYFLKNVSINDKIGKVSYNVSYINIDSKDIKLGSDINNTLTSSYTAYDAINFLYDKTSSINYNTYTNNSLTYSAEIDINIFTNAK